MSVINAARSGSTPAELAYQINAVKQTYDCIQVPLISVIIPAYNCERYISQAVESVLNQSIQSLEIILLNDCSTDQTQSILEELAHRDARIRLIVNQCNIGAAASRNCGLDLARGEYIAFLDSDDVWLPDKLKKQLALMSYNKLDLCYTSYIFIDRDGKETGKIYTVPQTLTYNRFLRENVIGCSTAFFKANSVIDVRMRGEYSHEDYVFWLELLKRGVKAGGIEEPLTQYRVHAGSRSGNKWKASKNRWLIYRKFLQLPPYKAARLYISYIARALRKYYG